MWTVDTALGILFDISTGSSYFEPKPPPCTMMTISIFEFPIEANSKLLLSLAKLNISSSADGKFQKLSKIPVCGGLEVYQDVFRKNAGLSYFPFPLIV